MFSCLLLLCLFYVVLMILNRETRPEIWERFFVELENMFHHTQVIVQLRIKLLQLTLLIKELIYPLSERKIQKKMKDTR